MASKADRRRSRKAAVKAGKGRVGRGSQNAGRPRQEGERYPSGKLKPNSPHMERRDSETGRLIHRDPVRQVYVIGPAVGAQKIGIANDVEGRRAILQIGCPHKLVVHYATAAGDAARRVEREVHRALADQRVQGEWFWVTPRHAAMIIKETKRRVQACA